MIDVAAFLAELHEWECVPYLHQGRNQRRARLAPFLREA